MHLGIAYGAPLPTEYLRWAMAERMGWTLEYVDNLDVADMHQGLAVWEGEAKARKK